MGVERSVSGQATMPQVPSMSALKNTFIVLRPFDDQK